VKKKSNMKDKNTKWKIVMEKKRKGRENDHE
jgi:hypothetical protein